MGQWNAQTSFLGGEWSKSAQGRFDDPLYKAAMALCRNGHPIETGAWARRSGTWHIGPTKLGNPARLYKFDMTAAQPYNMVFGDNSLRFQVADRYAYTDDSLVASAIIRSTPVTIAFTTPHGWSSGDSVVLGGLGVQFSCLQNRQFQITVVDSLTISLQDAVTVVGKVSDVTPDVTFGPLAGTETVNRLQDIATPYSRADWPSVRSVQAVIENGGIQQSVAVLLAANRPTQQLLATPEGAADAMFSLSAVSFLDGPYFDPVPHGVTLTPGALTGNVTFTLNFPAYQSSTSYQLGDFVLSSGVNYQSLQDQNLGNTPASSPTFWAVVSPGIAVGPNGFVQTDLGRSVRFFSEPPLWNTGSNYSAGNVVSFNGAYWTALTSMSGASPTTGNINPNQPGNLATTWAINPSAAVWSWGKIVGFGNTISDATGVAAGTMTARGGLAAAFDGISVQTSINCACLENSSNWGVGSRQTVKSYVGKNFTSSPQSIGSVTVYPASDLGFVAHWDGSHGSLYGANSLEEGWASPVFVVNLRAKQTAPANSGDGTLLGSVTVDNRNNGSVVATAGFYPYSAAVTIPSNDSATSWNYVWVEYVFTVTQNGGQFGVGSVNGVGPLISCAECVFFAPAGSGSTSVIIQVIGAPLLYTTPIRIWRLGKYSDTTGYPDVGAYHEGRLFISKGANAWDASQPDDIYNFAPTEADGTVTDANAISYVFNAEEQNAILWMISDQQGVLMGTQGGEWLVFASEQNNVLTPTNIQAHRVTRIRCANVEPRRTDHTIVFVQANKRRLMEYFADIFSGKFQAPNLAEKAKHLTAASIAELAYQQDLMPVIWMRMGDGSWAGTSYKRDSLMSSQGPTFNGWHRHDLGTEETIISVAVGPNIDGTLESLSIVTDSASPTAPSYIQVLGDVFEETDTLINAHFLDNALSPNFAIVAQPNQPASGVLLTGLWIYNGQTVTVFGCGLDLGDYLVANSQITVPFGDGVQAGTAEGQFTAKLVASLGASASFIVGKCFTSQGQQLRPVLPEQTGSRTGPALGMFRRAAKAALMFAAGVTRTLGLGTLVNKTRIQEFKSPGERLIPANVSYSGVHWGTLDDAGANLNGGLAWSITRPLPAIIPATISDVEVGHG